MAFFLLLPFAFEAAGFVAAHLVELGAAELVAAYVAKKAVTYAVKKFGDVADDAFDSASRDLFGDEFTDNAEKVVHVAKDVYNTATNIETIVAEKAARVVAGNDAVDDIERYANNKAAEASDYADYLANKISKEQMLLKVAERALDSDQIVRQRELNREVLKRTKEQEQRKLEASKSTTGYNGATEEEVNKVILNVQDLNKERAVSDKHVVIPKGFGNPDEVASDDVYPDYVHDDAPLVNDTITDSAKDEKGFSAKQLADLLVRHCAELSVTNDINGSAGSVVNNPDELTLFQRLTNFYANTKTPNSEDFNQIKAVYNGRGISPSGVVAYEDRKVWKFAIYDETSELQVCIQEKDASTKPPIYGIFGGPSSPNNRKPIDFADCCFMLHDISYGKGGYFNYKGDLQLISRLTQNRDKWPADSVSLLNSIVTYFSTVGLSVAYLKGSLPDNVTEEVVDANTRDDVFPVMQPEALDLPAEEYNQARFEFYKDFSAGMETASKTSSVMAVNGAGGRILAREFGNLMVEVL